VLGILKAGGAYVPIDPDYPHERIVFMLKDARIPLLLTQRSNVEKLPADQTQLVCLDEEQQAVSSYGDENLDSGVRSNNLAYVIYTSGSTGTPKGVLITHGSVVNHGVAMARSFGLGPDDRVLQFHSISFDAAVEELFPTWFNGATLVLRGRGIVAPGLDFLRLIESSGVTVVNLPTAYWHEWVHELWRAQADLPACLRMVIVGGEKASADRYASWQKLAGVSQVRWLNTYGPTETTVSATLFEPGSCVPAPGEISIGRPIAGTEVYLLDANLLPVPIGAPGELYIGGEGLARGYLNRPELTAERFIPHPFSTRSGAHLYRTGDVARFQADGNIDYVGRVDQQVKIRGYRIELGEIETAIAQHPGVREVLVMAREDTPGDRLLVAYYLLQPRANVSASELRSFLRESLPAYMIPAAFVMLDTLPLTASGKIDRQSLKAPSHEQGSFSEQFVAPRTTMELSLALIWENVLNTRPIGVTDNFFELGGHSLLVLHVMAQVQKTFDREISLTSFFQSPTIEYLAEVLSESGEHLSYSALVPIQPHGSRSPFFCVHSLGGDVLQFYRLARHLGSDQPFYGLQAPHLSEIGEQFTSVEEMATLYIEALRQVQPTGPYYIGGYSFGSTIAFEMAQQLKKLGEKIGLLALLDGGSPLVMHKIKDRGDAITMAGFARDLARASGVTLSLPHDEIRRLEPEDGLNFIVESLRTANLVSPEVGLSWVRRFLQGVKTRTRALTNYYPEIYDGVITLFRSSESETESAKAWLEVGVDVRDPSRGWTSLSTQPLAIIHIPGHHVEMTAEPNVAVLAQLLKSSIDQEPALELKSAAAESAYESALLVEQYVALPS
jgi:amino acid adenylation domain-containing protein